MTGKTRKDRNRNESIHKNLGVTPIGEKMRENRLRWFNYEPQRQRTAPVRRNVLVRVEVARRTRGTPKMIWIEVVRKEINAYGITENMSLSRVEWRNRIRVVDRK